VSTLKENVVKLDSHLSRLKKTGIKNRIAGKDVAGSAGVFESTSPVDNSVICEVAHGNAKDIDSAAQARDGQHLKSPTLMNITSRVPIGPVGVITPWNTPFMLSTWKIAPALAAGCTVVHKPAESSPLTARLLVEIAEEAGLPAGVLNTVNGFGEEAGKALCEHPLIKAIAFVGESRTGSLITKQGADTLKRNHLELGGKNPVVVFDDADLERALDAVIFTYVKSLKQSLLLALKT